MISLNHNINIKNTVKNEVEQACEAVFSQMPTFVEDFLTNTNAHNEDIAEFFSNNPCKTLVWCGTGGSYLSAKVISEVLGPLSEKKIYFLENLDAFKVESVLQKIDLKSTLFVFASKSGRTADVLILKKLLETRISNLAQNSLVLTQNQDSPLRKWAEAHQVKRIELPENICGRFSCFTPIGLLALNFYDNSQIKNWISGAKWALNQKSMVKNLCEFYLQSLEDEKWISVFWVYSSIFNHWGGWIQQLWAESLAKNSMDAKRVSTPLNVLGSLDQHSLLQQFSDGHQDKSFTFLTFNYPSEIDKNLQVPELGVAFSEVLKVQGQATYQALGDQPKMLLDVEYKNIEALSALFMMYQLVVVIMSELLNVYPFDQPGVEESKKIARQKLGF